MMVDDAVSVAVVAVSRAATAMLKALSIHKCNFQILNHLCLVLKYRDPYFLILQVPPKHRLKFATCFNFCRDIYL